MQIINASSAWLSSYEVGQHLSRQKEKREALAASLKHPPKCSENVLTIEFEVLEYLARFAASKLDDSRFAELMGFLLAYQLTKAEKLQIVNLLPTSPVQFYLIVEECEERFSEEQMAHILDNIQRIAGAPHSGSSAGAEQNGTQAA